MQTFLPYKDFESSARVLDDKRLGKQRVETMQIMHALVKLQVKTDTAVVPWGNHPVTKMWRGHENMLMEYQDAICDEWDRRGFNDTCRAKTLNMFRLFPSSIATAEPPYWLGLKLLHSTHRANLLRKDPEWYGQWGWKEEPQEGYWYPPMNVIQNLSRA
jgi:hypothetical protein